MRETQPVIIPFSLIQSKGTRELERQCRGIEIDVVLESLTVVLVPGFSHMRSLDYYMCGDP